MWTWTRVLIIGLGLVSLVVVAYIAGATLGTEPVVAALSLEDGSAATATSGADFGRSTRSPVGFAPGSANKKVLAAEPPVEVNPGDDIQEAVNEHLEGTAFLLKAGVHRMQSVTPKRGNSFKGELGPNGERLSIMTGAKVLTSFIQEGQYWVATGQTQEGPIHPASNLCQFPGDEGRCEHPEDLYFDDVPLRHETSKDAVDPGEWFFDYDADKIYLVDDPNGHVVETSVTEHAFQFTDNCAFHHGDDVTIENLVIEKYAVNAQQGAVQGAKDSGELSRGWTVRNNEVRLNHGAGIRIGDEMQVIDNLVNDNGYMGIEGSGDDVLVEGNEVARNNYAGFNWYSTAGGTKFVRTHRLTVRDNHVHHNIGPGLWTDISNIDTLYEDNLVTDNLSVGIFHEISYAAEIRNNQVKRNGIESRGWLYGAQIMISTSMDTEVHNNVVEVSPAGGNGITIVHQNRTGSPEPEFEPYAGINNYVHDNDITYYVGSAGWTGGAADYEPDIFYNGNNQFDYNTYHTADLNGKRWYWGGQKTWAEFLSQGHEANGSVDTDLPADETAPTAVTGLNASGDGYIVSLSWQAAEDLESGISGYNIYRDNVGGTSKSLVASTSGMTLDYIDNPPDTDDQAFYQVAAVNGTGTEGPKSNEVSILLDPVPGTPTGLIAQASNGQIMVDWDDNGEADLAGYNVYRSETAGGPYEMQNLSGLLGDSSYVDTTPLENVEYFYVATAEDALGQESFNSNEDSATVQLVPQAPTGLAGTPQGSQIALDWDDNGEGDLAGYNIYRSETSGGPYQQLNTAGPLADSSYVDTAITMGTDYYYVVTAEDTTQLESPNSEEVTVAVVDDAPATPTGLFAVAGDTQVILDWDNNAEGDLAGYNVYRSDDGGATFTMLNTGIIGVSNYTDTGLTNDFTYVYQVTAEDGAGQESLPAEVSGTPFGDNSLVGHWTFDEGSGTVVADSSGNENEGTLEGGAIWDDGQLEGGLNIGGSGDHVDFGTSDDFDSASFSITMWLKPNAWNSGGPWSNILMGREQYKQAGFRMGVASGGKVRLWTTQSGGTLIAVATDSMNLGQFHHVAITYDAVGEVATIYLDGVETASEAGTFVVPGGQTLAIGDAVGGTTPLNAVFDDLRLYNRALVPAEVQDLASADPSP